MKEAVPLYFKYSVNIETECALALIIINSLPELHPLLIAVALISEVEDD